MPNAPSIKKLQLLSDEDLIRIHDDVAQNTIVGTQFFLDELGRREQDRLNKEMLRLTQEMHGLTRTTARATYIALAIAILSLIVSLIALFLR